MDTNDTLNAIASILARKYLGTVERFENGDGSYEFAVSFEHGLGGMPTLTVSKATLDDIASRFDSESAIEMYLRDLNAFENMGPNGDVQI